MVIARPAEGQVREVARLPLATSLGVFQLVAFEGDSGCVYAAMIFGEVAGTEDVVLRPHSECVTGDVLGSLRCDCGTQLQTSLRTVSRYGRGVVIYIVGHEGRGIGLLNKLRAYTLQDAGLDTVDANVALGCPVDTRDFRETAQVVEALGVRSVRLLTNNPRKVRAFVEAGVRVTGTQPVHVAPSLHHVDYLRTKRRRLGHDAPPGPVFDESVNGLADAASLLGRLPVPAARPRVVLRYAQTLDGRIATRTGDSRWIRSEDERRLSHALRAACDAVAVGIGTVLADDPRLTVRMVPGAHPIRIVFDSRRRTPPDAAILGDEASTIIVATQGATTTPAWPHLATLLEVPPGPGGVDLGAALGALQRRGIRVLLVEGGARLITSFLAQGLADRIICSISPRVIGAGIEAVNDLGVTTVGAGLRLDDTTVIKVGGDIVLAGDVVRATRRTPEHAGPVGSPAGGE